MSYASEPVKQKRSFGVDHPPDADIESIRDLLRGYGSAASILKELIQNAEDAQYSGPRKLDHPLRRKYG